jgi:hypothetical protein
MLIFNVEMKNYKTQRSQKFYKQSPQRFNRF